MVPNCWESFLHLVLLLTQKNSVLVHYWVAPVRFSCLVIIEPPVLDKIKAASNFFPSSGFWVFVYFTRKCQIWKWDQQIMQWYIFYLKWKNKTFVYLCLCFFILAVEKGQKASLFFSFFFFFPLFNFFECPVIFQGSSTQQLPSCLMNLKGCL